MDITDRNCQPLKYYYHNTKFEMKNVIWLSISPLVSLQCVFCIYPVPNEENFKLGSNVKMCQVVCRTNVSALLAQGHGHT